MNRLVRDALIILAGCLAGAALAVILPHLDYLLR